METISWKDKLTNWIKSDRTERFVMVAIVINAAVLGLQTYPAITARAGGLLHAIDLACLAVFIVELLAKMIVYGRQFWKTGWNWFDFIVVMIAIVPASGPFSVLRALRVLRVLRLVSSAPSLRRVIEAFLHAIPGLSGVLVIMTVFFYVMAVLATNLFSATHPQWFGSIGDSLYSLFQIMTLESWSMGIVRPVMEVHPWAWIFFISFIVIATFTILNLFIGIIVSTMQELAMVPDTHEQHLESLEVLERIENDLVTLRQQLANKSKAGKKS